jgi:hypothetical protein
LKNSLLQNKNRGGNENEKEIGKGNKKEIERGITVNVSKLN